jgi:hypothetical protein
VSAPVATLPLPDNDAKPSRPVYFTNKTSAVAFASRCARQASKSGIYELVRFVPEAFQPVEGGVAFQATLGVVDWEVRAVAPAELARLVEAGIRAAVQKHLNKAAAHELAAGIMRPGAVHAMHKRYAAEERDLARQTELLLTVAPVRRVPSDEDAFEAANRALPAHLQRD